MVALKDIAEKAGVSKATVSCVLSGSKGIRVGKATRQRVMEIVKELGYRRNIPASSAFTGKTRTFAFIAHMLTSEFRGNILTGAIQAAMDEGYYVKPFACENDSLQNVIDKVLEARVDGVILCSNRRNYRELSRELKAYDIPIVVVDNYFPDLPGTYVMADEWLGLELIAEHLLELGHETMAFMPIIQEKSNESLRAKIFLDILKSKGKEIPENLVFTTDLLHPVGELYEKMFIQVMNAPEKPTALFCESDIVALHVLRTALKNGIKVPEHISIAGFADLSFASLSYPALTTVHQNFVELGATATGALLELLNSHPPLEPILKKIDMELMVRESCGKPENLNYETGETQ